MSSFDSEFPSSLNVPLPTDEKGMVGRECPNQKCLGYFKVLFGTGYQRDDLPCHCPYCGHKAPHDAFWTRQQLAYIESVAIAEFTDAMIQEFKKLEFDTHARGSFGVSMRVEPGPPQPIHYYCEKSLETDIECSGCTLRYSIYGVFGYCPDCGVHNSRQILEKNLEIIDKMVALASGNEKEVAEKLTENALEDCVSAFDGFGRELCRINASKSTTPGQAEKISFQSLDGAKINVGSLFGIDLSSCISSSEWTAAYRGFQKRHLLAHKMGVIDAEYVAKANDPTAEVGRKVVIREEDVRAVMAAVRSMAQHLSDSLAK